MNKKDLKTEYNNFLSRHKIKACDFVLGAGGACVMLGVREITNDMDMDLEIFHFNSLKNTKNFNISYFRGTPILDYNNFIDIHPKEKGEVIEIEGVVCWSAKRILNFKLSLNRLKDQEDIKKLSALIKDNKYETS